MDSRMTRTKEMKEVTGNQYKSCFLFVPAVARFDDAQKWCMVRFGNFDWVFWLNILFDRVYGSNDSIEFNLKIFKILPNASFAFDHKTLSHAKLR